MKKTLALLLSLPFTFLLNAQTSVQLTPVHDHYIESYGGGQGKNSFLKFDISSIPSNAVITAVSFNAYSFYRQPSWDGDMRFIRFNNQTWLETDSIQYTWNTLLFMDTILHPAGFGMMNGYSQSVDLMPLFMPDFSVSNTYFSLIMKDPDDGTCCPMMSGLPFDNTDSLLSGNIFDDRMGFRPRNYGNPNQRPYLLVTYSMPPNATLPPGDVYCEEDALMIVPTLTGDSPMTYQWLYNGAPMAGETNDTLIIDPLALSDSGAYSVIVTNAFGVDTSNQTSITVSPININNLGNDTLLCNDQTIQLNAGGGYVTYTWSTGGSMTQFLNVDTALVGTGTSLISVMVLNTDGCFSYDTVSITFDPCSSGINEAHAEGQLNILPNPHHGVFSLQISPLANDATYDIVNVLGEVVYTSKVSSNNVQQVIPVNITDLPNGIYFIRLYNSVFNHIQKTIKE